MTYKPINSEMRWDERGSVMIVTMLLSIVLVGIVVSGASILKSSRAKTETAFLLTGQASQFARSGLMETINWLRRQPEQPALAFNPKLDTTASPKILDTEDPDIGIMREFKISGKIWGRYEVWKQWDTDPDPERLAWRQKLQSVDVSLKRGRTQPGSVWLVRCAGYVYERRDAGVDMRAYPNRVLASEILEAEVSRLAVALPGQAALCVRSGTDITLGKNGRVAGGASAAGVFYAQSSGTPMLNVDSELTGEPSSAASAVYDDSIGYVFGVSLAELRAMADNHVEDEKDFPSLLRDGSITLLDGKINFGPTRSLKGSGIVVINGNCTINPGSTSSFSGLLYVDGKLTIHAPCTIRGAVIATGQTSVQGVGDFSEIAYDEKVLEAIQRNLGSYRLSTTARRLNQ